MNHGEVVQMGSPTELFERPATEHVGWFIGSPAMNFLPAVHDGTRITVPGVGLSLAAPDGLAGTDLKVGFRPEHARILAAGGRVGGTVSRIWYKGADEVLGVDLDRLRCKIRVGGSWKASVGEAITFDVPDDRLRLFSAGRLVG